MNELTYTIINSQLDKINMSSGRGSVLTTYDKLVELFGEPEITNCGKTQVEWDIEWSDGTISTIYDWKCYDEAPEEVTEWNIGGFDDKSLFYVQELLK